MAIDKKTLLDSVLGKIKQVYNTVDNATTLDERLGQGVNNALNTARQEFTKPRNFSPQTQRAFGTADYLSTQFTKGTPGATRLAKGLGFEPNITGYQPTDFATKAAGFGAEMLPGLMITGGVGNALKGTSLVKNAQNPLTSTAAKLTSPLLNNSRAANIAGKGLLNVSQGLPYSLGYQVFANAQRAAGERDTGTAGDFAQDIAFDAVTGSVPLLGATLAGVNSQSLRGLTGEALDNALVNKRAFSGLKDKGLRYFISDRNARLNVKALKEATNRGFGSLQEIYHHPKFFKEYPQAGSIPVVFDPKINAKGAFDERSGRIILNPNMATFEQLGTLLHENQHFVQGVENFARGGKPDINNPEFQSWVLQTFEPAVQNLPAYRQLIQEGRPAEAKKLVFSYASNQTPSGTLEELAHDWYKRISGEAEARAASTFKNLKQNEGLNRDLLAEQLRIDNIKPDEVIVRKGGGSAFDATDPLIQEARKYKSADEFIKSNNYVSNKADIEEFFKRDGDGYLFNSATVKANKKINKDGTIELVHLTTPEGKLGIEKEGFKEGTWFGLHNNRAISRPGAEPTVTMKIKVDPSDMAFGRYAINRSKLVKGADGVYRPEKVAQLTDIWNKANSVVQEGNPGLSMFTDRVKKGNTDDIIDSINRSQEYNNLANDAKKLLAQEVERLRDQVGGVGALKDDAGDIVARYSENAPWYREFFEANGRAPTNEELFQLAEENLRTGEIDGFWKQSPEDMAKNNEILNSIEPEKVVMSPDTNFKMSKGRSMDDEAKAFEDYLKTDSIEREFYEEKVNEILARTALHESSIPTVRGWFKKIFNPIKNAPAEIQDSVKGWRKQVLVGYADANALASQFAHLPEKDGLKLIRYMENPTDEAARNLGLNPANYLEDIENLRAAYDGLREQGLQAGLDVGYLENYLNHVWKESIPEIIGKVTGGGTKPSFVKERVIPDYETGIKLGLTPRFTHPAQLVAHYRYQLSKALANKQLMDNLAQSDWVLPSNVAPIDWKAIDAPAAPQLDGLKAPSSVAIPLNNIFSFQEDGAMSALAGLSKFVQDLTLSGGIPFTPVNAFTLANILQEVTAGRVRSPISAFIRSMPGVGNTFERDGEYLRMIADEGIRMGTGQDYTKMFNNLIESKTAKGQLGNLWRSAINKPTFDRFLPQLNVNLFKDVYETAIRNGVDETAARKKAAEVLRNFKGVGDNFTRSKSTEDALSAVFFAPRFRETMINFWVNNVRSLNPMQIGNRSLDLNRQFLVGTALTYAFYNELNKALTGHPMSENKDGKDFYLEVPRESGRSWFIPMLPSISTVPRRGLEMLDNLRGGDIAGAVERAGSLFSQPFNLASDITSNRTFYDAPIYRQEDSALGKVGKVLGYSGEQLAPAGVGEVLAIQQGRKTPLEGALGALELPVYPSKSTEVAHLSGGQVTKFKKIAEVDPSAAMVYAGKVKIKQANAQEKKDLKIKLKQKVEDTETTGLETLFDVEELGEKPTGAVANALWEKKAYTKAKEILNDDEYGLSAEQKKQIISGIGLDPADVEYYDLASQDNRIKSIFVRELASDIMAKSNDRTELLQTLINLRKEVIGEMVLSSGVISDLVEEGFITKDEGKSLREVKQGKDGTFAKAKVSGRGKSAKLKKVKFVPLSVNPRRTQLSPASNIKLREVPTSLPAQNLPRIRVNNIEKPQFKVKFNI